MPTWHKMCSVPFKICLQIRGDVKSNTEPTEEMLQKLLTGQDSITASINAVLSKQGKLEERLSGLEAGVTFSWRIERRCQCP